VLPFFLTFLVFVFRLNKTCKNKYKIINYTLASYGFTACDGVIKNSVSFKDEFLLESDYDEHLLMK